MLGMICIYTDRPDRTVLSPDPGVQYSTDRPDHTVLIPGSGSTVQYGLDDQYCTYLRIPQVQCSVNPKH